MDGKELRPWVLYYSSATSALLTQVWLKVPARMSTSPATFGKEKDSAIWSDHILYSLTLIVRPLVGSVNRTRAQVSLWRKVKESLVKTVKPLAPILMPFYWLLGEWTAHSKGRFMNGKKENSILTIFFQSVTTGFPYYILIITLVFSINKYGSLSQGTAARPWITLLTCLIVFPTMKLLLSPLLKSWSLVLLVSILREKLLYLLKFWISEARVSVKLTLQMFTRLEVSSQFVNMLQLGISPWRHLLVLLIIMVGAIFSFYV